MGDWVETTVKDFLGLTPEDERVLALMTITSTADDYAVCEAGEGCVHCDRMRILGQITRNALSDDQREFIDNVSSSVDDVTCAEPTGKAKE